MGRPFRPPISSGPGVWLSRSSKQAWLPLRRRPGSRVANSQHTEAKPDVTASTRVKDSHRKRIGAATSRNGTPRDILKLTLRSSGTENERRRTTSRARAGKTRRIRRIQ
jgi:hypothetical protein